MDIGSVWQANRDIAPVAIAVLGWLASHGLAIRAQRIAFVNQIRDNARIQIGEAFKEYEDWCSTLSARLAGLEYAFAGNMPPWEEDRWSKEITDLLDLVKQDVGLRWVFALEENDILFPRLTRARRQLVDRNAGMLGDVHRLLASLWYPARRQEGAKEARLLAESVRELGALGVYMHIAVQNVTLAPILHRRVTMPAPRDVELVRLVERGRGFEFGFGKPAGRVALVLRRLFRLRLRAVLDEGLPDQKALFRQIRQTTQGHTLPIADCWVIGEGKRMAVQLLDAQTGRSLWLRTGTPQEILDHLRTWLQDRNRSGGS